jgi:hypothetical protein
MGIVVSSAHDLLGNWQVSKDGLQLSEQRLLDFEHHRTYRPIGRVLAVFRVAVARKFALWAVRLRDRWIELMKGFQERRLAGFVAPNKRRNAFERNPSAVVNVSKVLNPISDSSEHRCSPWSGGPLRLAK